MKIDDLSTETIAKFQEIIEDPGERWFEVETPYLDSNGDPIKLSFIPEAKNEYIGIWFTVTDNGLLGDKLKLGEFLEENFWPCPLNEHNDYVVKTNADNLGNTIINTAKFISGISNMVKAKQAEREEISA